MRYPAVIANKGDTLGTIAHRELGNATKWPILAAANHLVHKDDVLPGDLIVIGGTQPLPFSPRHHSM